MVYTKVHFDISKSYANLWAIGPPDSNCKTLLASPDGIGCLTPNGKQKTILELDVLDLGFYVHSMFVQDTGSHQFLWYVTLTTDNVNKDVHTKVTRVPCNFKGQSPFSFANFFVHTSVVFCAFACVDGLT